MPTLYTNTIHRIDPAGNAVGVDASMRLQHGTLDHLSDQKMRTEVNIARQYGEQDPGFLERCAESCGLKGECARERRPPDTGQDQPDRRDRTPAHHLSRPGRRTWH